MRRLRYRWRFENDVVPLGDNGVFPCSQRQQFTYRNKIITLCSYYVIIVTFIYLSKVLKYFSIIFPRVFVSCFDCICFDRFYWCIWKISESTKISAVLTFWKRTSCNGLWKRLVGIISAKATVHGARMSRRARWTGISLCIAYNICI